MKPLVERLAGKNDSRRALIINDYLDTLQLNPQIQAFDPGKKANIVADLPYQGRPMKKILLSSHYDVFPGSPGANDNASAVAVLLGIASLYCNTPALVPIRLAFFDAEETGLLGSKAYIQQEGVKDIAAVLNMEMVGQGSIPTLWPYDHQSSAYCQILKESAADAHFVPYTHGHSGDHQNFLDAQVQNSICLTLIHEEDRQMLEDITRVLEHSSLVDPLIIMRKISASHTFRTYHRDSDTIEHIREDSLQLAQQIVLNVVQRYAQEDGINLLMSAL